ncbi:ABC transporter permease [Clostridium mediterraneense]|uniref:ABC transporter permease n=1 Tax=Clostridium mediterraneense TaxID=1805472 RepID=UPI000837A471|nr:ABC transporter permease [Clostridium mediterraneense]
MKKIFRKSFLVCLSIFSISIFSIFMFSIIRSESTNIAQMNSFYTTSRVDVSLNSTKITNDLILEYIKILTKDNDVVVDLPGGNDTLLSVGFSKGLYFTKDFGEDFPLLRGRLLNSDDMNSTEPLALIGKEFEKFIIKKDNLEYITLKNIDYKVVGILGEKNIKNDIDSMIFYNLNSLFYNLNSLKPVSLSNIVLNSETLSSREIVKKIENTFPKESITSIEEIGAIYLEPSKLSIAYQIENIIPFVLVIIAFVCTLIRGLIFWGEKLSLELGVRLSLGATKKSILVLILKRFTIIYFMSSILATMIAIIIQRAGIITIFSMKIDSSVIGFIAILYILLLITTILTICWKVFRLNPKNLIRG